MKSVLVIGNGFVGSSLFRLNMPIHLINHSQIYSIDYSKYDIVVNTALSPLYRYNVYDKDHDIDIKICELAAKSGCYYVMFSSRKVYGNSKDLIIYDEDTAYNPFDYYSENKVITEQYIIRNFSNYCIIRGSNFFGFEVKRNSFFGYCADSLLKFNSIKYTFNKNIIRDFIHIEDVIFLFDKILLYKPIGIFNLGLNYGIPIGDIANYMIEGYGSGKLFYDDDANYDQQFILNTSKLYKAINFFPSYDEYGKKVINIGKQLREYNDHNSYRMV